MITRKVNHLTELKRIRRQMADPYDRAMLDWAVQWVKAGLAQTDIERLERMFRLPDPR